jgi:hypothetical protein
MTDEFSIAVKTKNLFLTLAESIAQTLNVTSCCLRGNQHGKPLALGDKGVRPTSAFQCQCLPTTQDRQASGSLKLPLSEIIVSPAKEKNSPSWWGT